ncbi:nitrous oxide reductase accessory protein NosL [Pseudoruegeria sp. SHC-113]|uniref:nitrous oxide reductase accessory protein NosL n=1 Tax=Pseudoruegeria sp. SHC-113 TaxID=2855439 RepID=UPI0021BB4B84|nr:nitrous oxide reductase accessory protein NosL [Pseudoruegeria sp. SHC-113]MCT8159990.1 nitrous oxide reductase accessory protein NosL [Pseudoruegeria sp. SHC-113]
MTRFSLLGLATLLLLSACKEEQAAVPAPVDITAEAAGYYCQMELIEHDGPKGQIHLEGLQAPLFFSQVRDAVAYLHMPEQNYAVTVAYVQDMSEANWAQPGPWIAARSAHYVIGSDRMGGMGAPEFVPFASPDAADAFARKHGGAVYPFAAISAQDVLSTAPASTAATEKDNEMSERLRRLTSDGEKS